MQCQADIQKMADQKLKESQCLIGNGYFDGAYYLGGYAVELLLKAKVCKTLGIDDFFAFKRFKKEFYRPYKVHDYEELLILSGLYSEFVKAQTDVTFKTHWSIVGTWNENARYLTGKSSKDARDFLISLEEIVKWIEKHL
jgi:HEPN domain-containing protein